MKQNIERERERRATQTQSRQYRGGNYYYYYFFFALFRRSDSGFSEGLGDTMALKLLSLAEDAARINPAKFALKAGGNGLLLVSRSPSRLCGTQRLCPCFPLCYETERWQFAFSQAAGAPPDYLPLL